MDVWYEDCCYVGISDQLFLQKCCDARKYVFDVFVDQLVSSISPSNKEKYIQMKYYLIV